MKNQSVSLYMIILFYAFIMFVCKNDGADIEEFDDDDDVDEGNMPEENNTDTCLRNTRNRFTISCYYKYCMHNRA